MEGKQLSMAPNIALALRWLSMVLNSALVGRPAVRSANRLSRVTAAVQGADHSCDQTPLKLTRSLGVAYTCVSMECAQ